MQQRIADAKEREREEKRAAAEKAALVELNLQKVAAALAEAKAAFARGEFEEAERQFTAALESNAENRHEVVCNRAACALKLGRFEDAVSDAAESTYLEPSYVKGHYRLSCAQQALGKFDRALKACRAGLALQPASPQLVSLEAALLAALDVAARSVAAGPVDVTDDAACSQQSNAMPSAVPTAAAPAPSPPVPCASSATARKDVEAELAKLGWTKARAAASPGQAAVDAACAVLQAGGVTAE